jgi:leucyl/phenylalanyl-tRNA--protein transferase
MLPIHWISAEDPPDAFPDARKALREPDGLLAAGGDVGVQRLLAAYPRGIFPWYEEGQPVLWWSPDPRAVLRPEALHVSRSLRRSLRRSGFVVTWDRAFPEVVRRCAEPRAGQSGTWITEAMHESFCRLAGLGWAHSVEIWSEDVLVGGIYGLSIGRVFFGESMFSRRSDASKIAMVALAEELRRREFALIDCQVVSSHLLTMGAGTMPRRQFLQVLAGNCEPAQRLADLPSGETEAGSLVAARRVANPD